LLTFSRGIEGKHALVQLKPLIREMQTILRQTLPKTIQVQTDIASDLWPLAGDVTQLHQVLLNLCINARDAMPHGGILTIKASNQMLDEHFAAMRVEARAGPYVRLCVIDTGTGMPPEVRERIFDPFFTTKPPEKGTGLGLSTVQGIVKSHEGFISVTSEVGKGSEFQIYLPARPSDVPSTEREVASTLPSGRGELILVADDEEAVRVLSKKTLEAFGYQVLTASDGAQAVAVCAQRAGKIDLLLTDVAMPIMDGTATIRAVRTLDPKLKIIAWSGFDAEGRSTQPEPFGANAFIQKPFTAERLLTAIRLVLDSPE
jgi:two-component system, cell cycle sensor histidine kinase and response regulator CckA